jgi:fructose-specific phosphotransferase system IIA component
MGIYATDAVKLSSLLRTKCIELDLKGKDKAGVISELAELIDNSGKIKNKKMLVANLLEREKMGSTAIGNGVAIPHTKVEGAKETIMAFGRSKDGVDFNSLDGEKTYIFFALVSSKDDVGIHLKILAKVSHLIKDKFTVGLFKKAKTKEDVLKIVSETEKNL